MVWGTAGIATEPRWQGRRSEGGHEAGRLGPPPNRTDYFLSGSAALTGGRYNDALKSLSRAVELEPGFYRRMALGVCQDRLMKYSDAAASFTTAIASGRMCGGVITIAV